MNIWQTSVLCTLGRNCLAYLGGAIHRNDLLFIHTEETGHRDCVIADSLYEVDVVAEERQFHHFLCKKAKGGFQAAASIQQSTVPA